MEDGELCYRNLDNIILDTAELQEGERVQLLLPPDGPCVRTATGQSLDCAPIPGFLMDMVQAGGLLALLKQRNRSAPHGG